MAYVEPMHHNKPNITYPNGEAVFETQSKSCRSSWLESQIINIQLKKNQQKVPGPPPKLSALDWQTCGNFQHCGEGHVFLLVSRLTRSSSCSISRTFPWKKLVMLRWRCSVVNHKMLRPFCSKQATYFVQSCSTYNSSIGTGQSPSFLSLPNFFVEVNNFVSMSNIILQYWYMGHVVGVPVKIKRGPGTRFNIKMLSYQYRKSHCGDKMVVRTSYLHNGISYTGKTTSLYWIRALPILLLYIFSIMPSDDLVM